METLCAFSSHFSRVPLPQHPGNHQSTFCSDEFPCSGHFIEMESHLMWPFVWFLSLSITFSKFVFWNFFILFYGWIVSHHMARAIYLSPCSWWTSALFLLFGSYEKCCRERPFTIFSVSVCFQFSWAGGKLLSHRINCLFAMLCCGPTWSEYSGLPAASGEPGLKIRQTQVWILVSPFSSQLTWLRVHFGRQPHKTQ